MRRTTRVFLAAISMMCLTAVASALDAPQIPNSLHDANVGEWAVYSVPNGYQQMHTVLQVLGEGPSATVTVRVDNLYDGEVVSSAQTHHEAGERYHPAAIPDRDDIVVDVEEVNVKIKGTDIAAVVVEVEQNEEDMEWYLSEQIPVFGMIKQYRDGDLEYELIDFGWE
ncbi:MAG: hypothetical protein LIP23_04595 [Planctomycetes bacterium]|nr:hypothetical protein [Planctomycetota bacterium]